MKAFHNNAEIKAKYVKRVDAHIKADNLIRGEGWTGEKGCAIGCTLEAYNHRRYESELGIPEWLAKVEDTLFEGMSLQKSKTWPRTFLKAINVGADLEKVKVLFLVAVLKQSLKSMNACKYDKDSNAQVVAAIEQSKAAVKEMIRRLKSGDDTSAAANAAWSASANAAESVTSATNAAANAAESARSAAESAARSVAWSVAASVESSGESAAWSVASATSAANAAYDSLANELIKLLKACK